MPKTELDALTTLDDGFFAIVTVSADTPETLTLNPAWWVRGVVGLSGTTSISVKMTDTDDVAVALGTVTAGAPLSLPNLNIVTLSTSDPSATCFLFALKPFRPYLTDYFRMRLRVVTGTVQGIFATPTEVVLKVGANYLSAFQQGATTALPALTEASTLQALFYLLTNTAKTLKVVADLNPYLNAQTDDVALPETLREVFRGYAEVGWTGDDFKVELIAINEDDLVGLQQALRDALTKLQFNQFVLQTLRQ
jgi:hypothetical protein